MRGPSVRQSAHPWLEVSLIITVALLVAATAALVAGCIGHNSGWIALSLVCTMLSAVTLTGFARAILAARGLGHRFFAAWSPLPGPVCPIEDYDSLRVADILPLLQELDATALRAVAWHEHLGQSRGGVLARVTTLLDGRQEEEAPPEVSGLDESLPWSARTGSASEQ